MENLEIRANSKEEAIEIAKSEYNLTGELEVVEKESPKKILGFLKKNGVYTVTVVNESKVEVKTEKNSEVVEKKEVKSEIKDLTAEITEKVGKLIELMNLDLNPEVKKIRERNYVVNLNGKDNGIVIGRKGKTLNSLEYLINSMFKDCRVEVDVEGFKEKRDDTLRQLANKMAKKVIYTQKAVKLNPMPPRERKVIHEVLNTYEELDTYSEGKDPKRYIVIRLKKNDEENI